MSKNVIAFLSVLCLAFVFGCKNDDSPTKSSGAKPASPTTLGASNIGSTQIILVWKDNSSNETGFRIERGPGGSDTFGVIATVGADTTTFTDSGLTPGVQYHYRVKAFNKSKSSGYSNVLTVTTAAQSSIIAPSDLTATAVSGSQIDLKWKDNSNNESGFQIERAAGTGGSFTVVTSVGTGKTTFQDTGLSPSTLYRYRIRAFNATNFSEYSAEASATTLPSSGFNAPTNLIATPVSSSLINLSWTDNTDNESGFKIERAPGGSEAFAEIGSVGSNVTSYQNTGLTEGTTYRYRVRAYNSTSNSGYSNIAEATTSGSGTLNTPTNLTATAVSSSQINLEWTDNSDNENGFKVERSLALANSWSEISGVGAGVTQYQDKGLPASTDYKYRVKAYNSSSESGYSNIAQAGTQAAGSPPAAPIGLTATAVSTSQINLAWTNATGDADGTKIERAGGDNPDFTEIAVVGSNVTSYQDTGLQSATLYSYRVCAFNAYGNSVYSTASAKTEPLPVQAPVLTGPETSSGTFTLTMTYNWPGLASNWDCYELEESTTSYTEGFTNIHKSPAGQHPSPYTVDLTRGAGTYYYRARVYAGSGPNPGLSAYSEAIRVIVSVTQVTRFANNTSYPIISLQVDGAEQFPASPYGIIPGNYYQLPLNLGNHSYRAVNGFWDGPSRFEMYTWTGTFQQPAGIQTVTFNDPTINQLLTRFQSTGTWEGSFWQNLIPHTATFKFTSSGTWTLYVDGNYSSQGTYSLVQRQPQTFSVVFSVGSFNGTLYETLGYFMMQNGPSDWKIIEYYYKGP